MAQTQRLCRSLFVLKLQFMSIIDKLTDLASVFKAVYAGDFSTESAKNLELTMQLAQNKNAWFDKISQLTAFKAWGDALNKADLGVFAGKYPKSKQPKNVLVICAGNLPLVGFHDVLCVLLSGHKAIVKLSSEDEVLMRWALGYLDCPEQISLDASKMKAADAVIATGSGNTNRYFEHYFGEKPHVFRKNRSSIAVLDGTESIADLANLGDDVFMHYGKGCRNVTQLLVPKDYDITKVLAAWEHLSDKLQLNKYQNNYEYNKAVFLINSDTFLDNGSVILRQQDSMFSPLGVVHYQFYENEAALKQLIAEKAPDTQCLVGKEYIPFGEAQKPKLNDYADGVDTMAFLSNLG